MEEATNGFRFFTPGKVGAVGEKTWWRNWGGRRGDEIPEVGRVQQTRYVNN